MGILKLNMFLRFLQMPEWILEANLLHLIYGWCGGGWPDKEPGDSEDMKVEVLSFQGLGFFY